MWDTSTEVLNHFLLYTSDTILINQSLCASRFLYSENETLIPNLFPKYQGVRPLQSRWDACKLVIFRDGGSH